MKERKIKLNFGGKTKEKEAFSSELFVLNFFGSGL
jgi:hypothetical protein